jgi:hypothetical protein
MLQRILRCSFNGNSKRIILTLSDSHRDVHSTINGHHLRIASRRPVFDSLCLPIVSHTVLYNLYVLLVCFVCICCSMLPTYPQYLASRSLDWQGALLWPATWYKSPWTVMAVTAMHSHRFRSLYHRVVASSQALQIPSLLLKNLPKS